VTAAKPDAVIVDLSLGYNTDFDIVDAAMAVGARVVIFSHNADHKVLDRYAPRPIVVRKPDFQELEHLIEEGLPPVEEEPAPGSADRRRRPARVAIGPEPTGVGDAQAFYEALGNAVEGDAVLSVEPRDDVERGLEADDAVTIAGLVRHTDRVLAAARAVKVLIPGGGEDAAAAFEVRLGEHESELGASVMVRSVVLGADESGADAFARLKRAEGEGPA
jgi:hypothetical protein